MNYFDEYDRSDPLSIEKYAQKLVGKTFQQVCDEDDDSNSIIIHEDSAQYNARVSDKKNKGGLGGLIEERFFHYECNDDSRPDFYEAGVELKVSPYRIASGNKKVAKERLIITMINYMDVVNETFENSHLWAKSRLILLIYYLYNKEIKNRLDYRIDYARLFTPSEQDIAIIKNDFEIIVNKIKAGKAHELSEGDTMYLGAATKASTSDDRRKQPYSDIQAKPRAFSFKNSYMTYVLNNYIIPGRPRYESAEVHDNYEQYVVDRISRYRGYTVSELCEEFDIDYKKKTKNLESMIAFRILGTKGNETEEFLKAGIKVKTIRIGGNGKIKENMSFPTFKFKEIVNEDWETSTFREYLADTRFFFVIYGTNGSGELYLKGCMFWNIPYEDLEGNVKDVWSQTRNMIRDGLKFEIVNGRYVSELPKVKDNPICHVRPHGQNSNDTYELPDGRVFPKQCFWLKNDYILNQINNHI